MTNLSGKKKNKKFISPERAVLFVPASAGILIGIILILIFFVPEIIDIRNKNADIKILNEKIEYIPLYEKKLSKLLNLLRKRIEQSNRLIDLVAGKEELRTILAKLNEISNENNVRIIEIKPEPIVLFSTSQSNKDTGISTPSTPKNDNQSDKLLLPTIKKYPFNLNLVGQYEDIINFLRDLELIKTIVLSSGLELRLNPSEKGFDYNINNKEKDNYNEISVKLKLIFYGRDNLQKKSTIDTNSQNKNL